MARRSGIVGALLVAAFVVARSASTAAAEGGTPAASSNGGCAIGGDTAPVTSARMPVATEPAAAHWQLHPVASNVGINSPYVLLATGTHSAVVLAVARSIDRLILWAT